MNHGDLENFGEVERNASITYIPEQKIEIKMAASPNTLKALILPTFNANKGPAY